MPFTLKIFYLVLFFDIFLVSGMFIMQLLGNIYWMFPFWFFLIISLIITVMLVFRNPGAFEVIEDAISIRRNSRSKIINLDENKVINKLITLMDKEKIHLNPELRLSELSEELGITPHQLSELINTKYGMTFNNYINKYRIDHACYLLKTKHELSILDIAFQSGFNSKSTFYSVFKSVTGKTPTAFYKEVKS